MASPTTKEKRAAYHHGDLRRAILDAAVALIAEQGPDALSLREVARVVGVNHAATYRHFEDKRAVLVAVAEQGFGVLGERMREAAASIHEEEIVRRLQAIAAAYVGFALANPSHFRVMFGPRLNEDNRFPSLEEAIRVCVEVMVVDVRKGLSQGVLHGARARDVAMSIWMAAHGYTSLVLARRVRVKSPEVAQEYLATILAPLFLGLTTAPPK